jgi:hypothetical protein
VQLLPAFGGYAAYDHWWLENFHSAFTAGVVSVATLDIQPGSALSSTRRDSGNFMWEPIPRVEFIAEFLFGARVNKDGHSLRAGQIQIGGTFRF